MPTFLQPRILAAILILAAPCVFAQPSPWPQFRGPDSNPVAADPRLPDRWSATENVEWSAAIPGRGWSSPIVTGGKVFLTTVTTEGKSKAPQAGTEYSNEYVAELTKQGLSMKEIIERVTARDIEMPGEVNLHYFLYCLDLRTGAEIWKKEFHSGKPPGGRHRKNSFVSETPVTDGGRIYVYAGNLGLWAFDLNGKQVWTVPLEAQPMYMDLGTGGSPVVHGNRILISSDTEGKQFIAAYDKNTGKQLWRTERAITEGGRKTSWSTPFIWTHKQRTEIVTVGPGAALSYDLEGKELWRISGITSTPVPSPFVYDGALYVNAGMGRGLFAIRPGASGDISLPKDTSSNEHVMWSEARGGTYLPSALAYQGGLYTLTEKGIITRYDAKTGKQSYKSRLDPEAGYFTSSPWAYNGKIFCLSEEGKTFVAAAGPSFQLLHVNALDEMAQATPAIAGDRLLVRTESRLYSIRQREGGKKH